jgi:transcriptional regulator with XRE-family HTH domain
MMTNSKIAQILNRLMAEKKIRVTELARKICVPQPTIHRIAKGICEHPHSSSLEPIANFFGISISQLKGYEPIPWLDRASKIPQLRWEDVLDWPKNKVKIDYQEFILTDAIISKNGFALKMNDASMEPVFPKNTILITDPNKQPKDRSFVIVKLAKYPEVVFRQLLLDTTNKYLKSLSPDFDQYKMKQLTENDKILSTVIQTKRNIEDL